MENVIDEIKKKIDIIDFINSFTPLKKTGRNFKGLCPFHQEKTPSFVVSPDRQIWHCFGACQEGGDVFKFLMKWENLTFIEALRELAQKTGVKLARISFEDKIWKKKERALAMNSVTAEFFEFILQKTKYGEKAMDYLKQRSLKMNTVKKFQLGYAPQSWDSLNNFLKKKKYSDDEIIESGLSIKGKFGKPYDRFRGRLIFPLKDARGNIIGFSGRILDEIQKEAKYINSPESFLYHKRETLFGIDLAKEAIKKENNVILVEGEFDVISPYQSGIENIVAIKGSAVTREQLTYIKRFTNKITLAFDGDRAGEEAMRKGIEEAEGLDFDVFAVNFDFAKDPDEAIRTDPIKFKKTLKNPVPFYDFIIDLSEKKYSLENPYGKKQFADDVAGYIGKIKNPVIRSHYVKRVSSLLSVSEGSIEALIRSINRKKIQRFVPAVEKKSAQEIMREVVIQKYLLSVIFQSENPYKKSENIFKLFSGDDFSIPAYQKICRLFFEFKEKNKEFELNGFLNFLPAELSFTFDEIYLFASSEIEVKNEKIEKLVYEAKKYKLKREISHLLSSDNNDGEEAKERLKTINQELTKVEKKIITL